MNTMPRMIGSRQRTILALACVIVVGVGLVAAAFAAPAATPYEELAAARARWAARPFTRYRMVSRSGDCQQISEFEGDRFLYVKRQRCFDALRTVERLFRFVEGAASWGLSAPRCAPSGCACVEKRKVYAIFDEQYGYPHAIRLRKHRWIDWAYVLERPETIREIAECYDPPDIDLMIISELTPLE